MTVLLFVLGVLFVAVGIALSIALHELGHLLPAKLFRVRVTQYMIGFGPTLFSRRRGETEYGVKAIPLGGYVSMVGMFPPNPSDDAVSVAGRSAAGGAAAAVRPSSTGMFQQLATDARQAAAEQLRPGDENRVFYKLPVWKRIVIMLGGPIVNLLIGTVLIGVLVMGFGTAQATTNVAEVYKCVVPSTQQTATGQSDCLPTDPVAPAYAAGLQPGDKILSYAGRPVSDWYELTEEIRESAGRATPITYERNGAETSTTITPILTERPRTDGDGNVVVNADGDVETVEVGFVGMGSSIELVPQPASTVLPMVGDNIARVANVVLHLPQRMADVAEAAFSSAPRDPEGPMSVVGVGRIAGEVSAMEEIPLESRIATLIGLVGSLNIALFVFNLIPLLPLDGGHVAGALWEGLRRGFARLLKRADPGPFDMAKLLPVTYVVAGLLMVMGVLLIYADIVKPVNLFG